jgi:hypothetical protein
LPAGIIIIIGMPPHIIMSGAPMLIIEFIASQRSFIRAIIEESVAIIFIIMPSLVISQVMRQAMGVIMPIIICGIICGIIMPGIIMPFIIGIPIMFGIMPPMPIGIIIGIIMPFMPFMFGICGMVFIGMLFIIGIAFIGVSMVASGAESSRGGSTAKRARCLGPRENVSTASHADQVPLRWRYAFLCQNREGAILADSRRPRAG